MLSYNANWRSPEAHFRGTQNKPSEIFSFGAVCLQALLNRVIFGVDADFETHLSYGALPAMSRLQRQVCFFGDEADIDGLTAHINHEAINVEFLAAFWEDRSADYHDYKPFGEWLEIEDGEFRDVIWGMMHLNPARRITAGEALEHPWFRGIPDL